MAREGHFTNLLDDLHAPDCDGTEYSACRPVVVEETEVHAVYMEWCGECGAADKELI